MNSAAPTSITRLAPLLPRLTDAEVQFEARLVEPALIPPDDPRVAELPSLSLETIITGWRVIVTAEWPDGSLARAVLPSGMQAHEALSAALREAYATGRDALERLHLQTGGVNGNA